MNKKSLKNRCLNYLHAWYIYDPNKWIHKGELEDKAKELGYLGDNCGRRMRELAEEGKVEVRSCGKSIEYRFSPDINF